METWEGKSFSITDPKGVSTIIYQIIKTPKELINEYPKYVLERLDSTEEIRGDLIRKTFYVDKQGFCICSSVLEHMGKYIDLCCNRSSFSHLCRTKSC